MKYLLAILLIINPLTEINKIARVNKAKKEAEQAYLAGDYAAAQAKYQYLIDSLQVKDDRVTLNLANAQYHLQDSINALRNYKQLIESQNQQVSSLAYQQLGEIAFEKKEYEPALQHYKQSLKKNSANEDARYNYELLKKLIKEQEEQEQQNQEQQNEDQEKKDQENQDQEQNQENQEQNKESQEQQEQKDGEEQEQEQEQQEGEEQEQEDQEQQQEEQDPEEGEEQEEQEKPSLTPEEKLKELNISEEKAQMILEAMKNNEIQYIQQNKRKATKRKDSSKPDW